MAEEIEIFVPAYEKNLTDTVRLAQRLSFQHNDFILNNCNKIVQPEISSKEGEKICEYVFFNRIGSNKNAQELNKIDFSIEFFEHSLAVITIKD